MLTRPNPHALGSEGAAPTVGQTHSSCMQARGKGHSAARATAQKDGRIRHGQLGTMHAAAPGHSHMHTVATAAVKTLWGTEAPLWTLLVPLRHTLARCRLRAHIRERVGTSGPSLLLCFISYFLFLQKSSLQILYTSCAPDHGA